MDPFLTPFYTHVGYLFVTNGRLCPHLASSWDPAVTSFVSSGTPVAPLLAHGPLFAGPSKRFAGLGLHFWRLFAGPLK